MNIIPPAVSPPKHPRVYDHIEELACLYNSLNIKYRNTPNLGTSSASCGITILSGVSYVAPNAIVRKILVERSESDSKKIREAFVMWSDIDCETQIGGNALAKYIRDNNIGPVTEFGPVMNPNSGNMIKMWVWQPPHESHEPEDKWMPVFGHVRKFCKDGCCAEYVPSPGEASKDRRFLDDRSDSKLEATPGINPA